MTYLLDVNVLVALLDPAHTHHLRAQEWFLSFPDEWATCPITEVGVARILSQPNYPNSLKSPGAVLEILQELCSFSGYQFWAADISLTKSDVFNLKSLTQSAQTTDTCLLGLARAHGGKLATFDTRLSTAAVRDGSQFLHIIQ